VRHLETHSIYKDKLRNHKCDECGKKFFRASHVRRHLLLHIADKKNAELKPHACELCGKRFNKNYNRLRHKRLVHEKVTELEREYGCDICGKWFVRACYLIKHMKARHPLKVMEEPKPR